MLVCDSAFDIFCAKLFLFSCEFDTPVHAMAIYGSFYPNFSGFEGNTYVLKGQERMSIIF